MNRGKLVIVAIVVVALAAAVFSTWYRYRGQHRAMDYWGASTARLIAQAPEVKLFELDAGDPTPIDEVPTPGPVADAAGAATDKPEAEAAGAAQPAAAMADKPEFAWVEFGDFAWQVLATKEGTGAKGLSNLRAALVSDTTFDWRAPVANGTEPNWNYAIVVNDGRDWATILFDFESGLVALTGGRKLARLLPEASDDFAQFFQEQFPAPPATEPASEPAKEEPAATAEEKPKVEPAEAEENPPGEEAKPANAPVAPRERTEE